MLPLPGNDIPEFPTFSRPVYGIEVKHSASNAKVSGFDSRYGQACFCEVTPSCELFTSHLHIKYPLLTAQGVSQEKNRIKGRIIGMIKNARKIVTNRGRKRNPHSPSNPFSPRLVVQLIFTCQTFRRGKMSFS